MFAYALDRNAASPGFDVFVENAPDVSQRL